MVAKQPSVSRVVSGSSLAAALLVALAIAVAVLLATGATAKATARALGTESWTYIKPGVDLTKYRSVIVYAPTVYSGADAQFGTIDLADREKYATIMNDALRTELAKAFPTPPKAKTDTLGVQFTLIGAEKTVGGVATATRILPFGLAANALKSATDKQGTLTGSVVFGVELRDGRTGELLFSAIRRGTPDPLDVEATTSTTATVKSVARGFAKRSLERLLELTGAPPPPPQ